MKPTTKEWMRYAKDDLDVAQKIREVDHLTNIVSFHVHQTIEKCFKAVMEEYEINAQRIHNLATSPYKKEYNVLRYQLLRSATSIGANYEESQSTTFTEFIQKLRIALREANESNKFKT